MATINAPATPGIAQIGQIALAVKDVPRATAFYREVLGLPYLFETSGLVFFDCGGVRLMLSRAEQKEFDHPASIIYYKVVNIQESAAVLRSRGVTFEREPHVIARLPSHDLWMAFLRDPDGNMLALMCEMPRR